MTLLASQYFEVFSLKKVCFFVAISFNALYFAFLHSSLSMRSLDFLNFWKSLSLEFSFSKTSPSNHFWVFPFTRFVIKEVILSITHDFPKETWIRCIEFQGKIFWFLLKSIIFWFNLYHFWYSKQHLHRFCLNKVNHSCLFEFPIEVQIHQVLDSEIPITAALL